MTATETTKHQGRIPGELWGGIGRVPTLRIAQDDAADELPVAIRSRC